MLANFTAAAASHPGATVFGQESLGNYKISYSFQIRGALFLAVAILRLILKMTGQEQQNIPHVCVSTVRLF